MSNERIDQSGYANPAPLGLMGFGMTTVLLNLHNAGLYEINVVILAMGIFYGGISQIIAGVIEYKKGNGFGGLAFTSYGAFWLTLVVIFIAGGANPIAMGSYLALWGLFTLYMFIATLKQSMTNRVIFGSLVVLFALLAISKFAGDSGAVIGKIAGVEGIFCGLSAIYGAMAITLNDSYGKQVLPL
jgi:succinate-acetate transporter protein